MGNVNFCGMCGARLTLEISKSRGYGRRVCWKRHLNGEANTHSPITGQAYPTQRVSSLPTPPRGIAPEIVARLDRLGVKLDGPSGPAPRREITPAGREANARLLALRVKVSN